MTALGRLATLEIALPVPGQNRETMRCHSSLHRRGDGRPSRANQETRMTTKPKELNDKVLDAVAGGKKAMREVEAVRVEKKAM